MFENFGICDLWAGAKRYRLSLALLLLLCIAAGALYGYTSAQSTPQQSTDQRDTHRAFYTYGVNSTDPDLSSNQAQLFIKVLRTDPAKNFVTERINQKYSPPELQAALPIADLKGQPISSAALMENVLIKELQYTSSFAVVCDSFERQLSLDVCEAYQAYLETKLPVTINEASAVFLDKTVSLIPAGSRPADETALFGTQTYSPSISVNKAAVSAPDNMIKFGAFGLALGLALAFVLLLGKALLRPTLNRKSDFAKYDLPVLSEIGKMGYFRRS